MTYIDDVKKAELEMRKQFNMLRLEDISEAEMNFYDAFLKKLGKESLGDYLKNAEEKASLGRIRLNHIDDFIQTLTQNSDPTIQSHNERIELLNFELDSKIESLSKLPAEIQDTMKQYEAANKKLMSDSDKSAQRIKSLQEGFNKEKANIVLDTNKTIEGLRN